MVMRGVLILLLLGSAVAMGDGPSPDAAPAAEPALEAAETPAAKPPLFGAGRAGSPSTGSGVVTADPIAVVGGLLLVIVLIVLTAWLMRRVGGIPALGGQAMKVVAALSVGSREKVVLVDIAGTQILLGVAPGRVSHLQTFEQAVIDVRPAGRGDFSATIKQLLRDGKTNPAADNKPEKHD